MIPGARPTATIFSINAKLAGAALMAVTAYAIWPTYPKWWSFGMMSVILALAAVGNVIAAIRQMVALYQREKAIAELTKDAAAPKSARLASDDHDRLREAGVLDD
ncbi:hypothetical protein LNKW23_41870 [Paralimibaculum aggregatum]|uniref:YiaAB two helix domain-containing protein n=1 Tax=Paralimibaculum aggregatum TaxID=3036245 RepID=A0ABQ6LQE6_9RHOB|nr:hypothetical protein [Limibaculum sp. NKW23]GMG84971.1 hypothetical protein LNKW23_41870 [Limibaculum sp. NKW23]